MAEKHFHEMTVEDVMNAMQTDETGLAEHEAEARRKRFGPNIIQEVNKISPWQIFLNQFQDFMVLVLVVATGLSYLLGELVDAVTIVIIIIMNACLGFIQEYRAEKSLASLREMASPVARIRRNGLQRDVPAADLVPGDILLLEAGDRIAADGRLIEAINLDVEESALTGESVPVAKTSKAMNGSDLPLGDRKCMVYQGTLVTRGRGIAVVCATGMQTEMGKIAGLIDEAKQEETPLQKKLDQLGKILVIVCGFLSGVIVLGGLLHGQGLYKMLMTGVSLAVAAIPEGLPAIVTIALALGVQRMIKANAIVRKLPSVETLGCATIICSDKTGTITKNEMTVRSVYCGGNMYSVSGDGYQMNGEFFASERKIDPLQLPELLSVLKGGIICNNAEIRSGNGEWMVQGDPTEAALLVAGAKAGLNIESFKQAGHRRIGEIPFESERKSMSVLWQQEDGVYAYVKGAPDRMLSRCTRILIGDKEIPLGPEQRQAIVAANEQMARNALRVLAIAYKRLPEQGKPSRVSRDIAGTQSEAELAGAGSRENTFAKQASSTVVNQWGDTERWEPDEVENDLVFAGLIGMIDPPRSEVFEAIRLCKRAGLRAVMITGDHKLTAQAIARQLDMMPADGQIVTGEQLDHMSEEELAASIDNIYVFARVSPLHKLKVVNALKKKGHVVAMTGDGVNDAPAVKAADIGVAMGRKGTDVTKEASDIVLTDDNFATIVATIREGRVIFDNIRKFIRYLLACNTGEVMVMLLATMLALPLPLLPIQILLVNLVTDGLPAIALGVDPAAPDVMERRPRRTSDSIFAGGLWVRIVERGILIGVASLGAFWLGSLVTNSLEAGRTMATATLVISQLLHVFDCRSEQEGIRISMFSNRALLAAVAASFAILLAVVYVPLLQLSFRTVPLSVADWAIVCMFAFGSAWLVKLKSIFHLRTANIRPVR